MLRWMFGMGRDPSPPPPPPAAALPEPEVIMMEPEVIMMPVSDSEEHDHEHSERAKRAAKRARCGPALGGAASELFPACQHPRCLKEGLLHCAKCSKCLSPTDTRKVRANTADPLVHQFFCAPECTPTELLPRSFSKIHDMFDAELKRGDMLRKEVVDANIEIETLKVMVDELEAAAAAPGMCEACEATVPQCVHCLQRPATIACVPCGHRVVCSEACRAEEECVVYWYSI
jgi:hypothetical protein